MPKKEQESGNSHFQRGINEEFSIRVRKPYPIRLMRSCPCDQGFDFEFCNSMECFKVQLGGSSSQKSPCPAIETRGARRRNQRPNSDTGPEVPEL